MILDKRYKNAKPLSRLDQKAEQQKALSSKPAHIPHLSVHMVVTNIAPRPIIKRMWSDEYVSISWLELVISFSKRKRLDLSWGTGMQEHGQLVQALRSACDVAGLQPVPALVNKCLQLQDTMAVRFGVMLVGPAGETAKLIVSMSVHHVRYHALHH